MNDSIDPRRPSEGDDHDGLPIDAALRAAFGPPSTAATGDRRGVLEALRHSTGVTSRVLLRDEPDAPAPVVGTGEGALTVRRAGALPGPRRDRPRRDGGRPQGTRPRPRPRRGDEGAPPGPRRRPGAGPSVHRGGPDRRPAPAPRHPPGVRTGARCRPAALLHDAAGQGADPRRHAGGTARIRPTTSAGSSPSSSRSARPSPTPTPAA